MDKYYICIRDYNYTILKSIKEYERKIIKADPLRLWKVIEEKENDVVITDNNMTMTLNKYNLTTHFKEVTYIENLELLDKLNKKEEEKIKLKEIYNDARDEYDYIVFIKNGIDNLLQNLRMYNDIDNKNSNLIEEFQLLEDKLRCIKEDIPSNIDLLFEIKEKYKEKYLDLCIDYREGIKKINEYKNKYFFKKSF